MKKVLISALALVAVSFTACKKNNPGEEFGFNKKAVSAADYKTTGLTPVTLSGNYNTSSPAVSGGVLSLTNNNIYTLQGIVAIDGIDLNIQAGTIIVGALDANGKPGTLVVQRNSTIHATGTPTQPIIFTSSRLTDNNSATHAAPGEGVGVIILGDAPSNVVNKVIEGIGGGTSVTDATFGSANLSDSTDNSGVFRYARIEYAGYELSPNNEINALTLGGVGKGTTLDHIEAAYGKDDSFEFFGGTVDASYLVSIAADDDNFDTDNGYTGSISNSIALGDIYSTHSQSGGVSDSNGIESDNNADAEDPSYSLTPQTRPEFDHITIVGAQTLTSPAPYRSGARIRRGSAISITNSVIMGFTTGLEFNGTASNFGSLRVVEGNFLHGFNLAYSPNAAPATGYIDINNPATDTSSDSNSAPAYVQPFLNETSNINLASANLNGEGAPVSLITERWVRTQY